VKLKRVMGVVALGVWFWGGMPSAHGQKATEMFIPIGQSPGLSNTISVIGTIEAIDPQGQTIVIAGPAGSWSATITNRTKIWLDRSTLKQTNQTGSFADLKQGLLAEVKYEDPQGRSTARGPAEWIKVQIAEPSAKAGETRQ
jgi:acid phosphatase family membrane protein YuiD